MLSWAFWSWSQSAAKGLAWPSFTKDKSRSSWMNRQDDAWLWPWQIPWLNSKAGSISFLASLGLVVSSQQVFNVMTQSSTPCYFPQVFSHIFNSHGHVFCRLRGTQSPVWSDLSISFPRHDPSCNAKALHRRRGRRWKLGGWQSITGICFREPGTNPNETQHRKGVVWVTGGAHLFCIQSALPLSAFQLFLRYLFQVQQMWYRRWCATSWSVSQQTRRMSGKELIGERPETKTLPVGFSNFGSKAHIQLFRGLRPVRSGMIKLVHVTKASFC